jgi:hypothetical protein
MANYLDPYASELQGIQRQQEMAKMLLQQGQQQPQEQMVSGRVAPINPLQAFLPALNTYQGMNLQKNAESEQKKLADLVRGETNTKNEAIINAMLGKDYQPAIAPEIQKDDMGNVMPNVQEQSGMKADPRQALALALKSGTQFGESLAPTLLSQLTKPDETVKVGANETVLKVGKDGKPVLVYKNEIPKEPKFHTVGGNLVDEKGNIVFKAPKDYAPHPLQVVDTPNGMMTFNPNTQTMTPLMANGKPIMGTKGNLPEGATGQVTGVQNVISALGDLKNKIDTNKPSDMLDPNKRALMSTEYQNVVLQLKEAMRLGVLNGNDYQILTSMITNPNDPKALLISKETQLQQINNLNKKLNDMTKNVYKTHQREVPTNLMPTDQSNATGDFNNGSLADMAKQELARRTRQ